MPDAGVRPAAGRRASGARGAGQSTARSGSCSDVSEESHHPDHGDDGGDGGNLCDISAAEVAGGSVELGKANLLTGPRLFSFVKYGFVPDAVKGPLVF